MKARKSKRRAFEAPRSTWNRRKVHLRELRTQASDRISSPHEKHFQILLESVPDAILGVDKQGHILLVNRQAELLFGYDRKDLLQMGIEELLPPRLREIHARHRARYEEAPHVRRMGSGLRLEAFHKTGQEIAVDVTLSPSKFDGKTIVLCSVRDVSEQRRWADERETLIHQLEQALANIRKLSGLLPICAWCKRIRDQQGAWMQLESYIRGHSEADFSHGVCPDCVQKFDIEIGTDPALPKN